MLMGAPARLWFRATRVALPAIAAASIAGCDHPTAPPAPAGLAFVVEPMDVTAGGVNPARIGVAVVDDKGNTISRSGPRTITITLNGGNATLYGTTTATTSKGVATFADLSIQRAGVGYSLTASSQALPDTTSGSFTVKPAAAAQLIVATQPVGGCSTGPLPTQPVVVVQDAYTNLVTDEISRVVTAKLASGGGTIAGTTSVVASGGRATFADLALIGSGSATRTIAFESSALTGTSSQPVALTSPTSRSLAVGESVILSTEADLPCNQLSQGGLYVVSVFNTNTATTTASFQLRGGPLTAADQAPVVTSDPMARAAAITSLEQVLPVGEFFKPTGAERFREAEHLAHMDRQRALAASLGDPVTAWRNARAARALRGGAAAIVANTVAPVPTTIGATSQLNFRYNGSAIDVRTVRTAAVGPHVVVVEDVAALAPGAYDAWYASIVNDFETRMLGVLTTNFGNPLAMDALMNNTGRVTLFFTNKVTDIGNVAGFVTSCDVFPVTSCTASNEAPTAYLHLPGATWTPSDISWWQQYMHAVVQHEAKHIVSGAERTSRGYGVFDESWAEEGSAEIAKEIYARGMCGFAPKQKLSFNQIHSCELGAAWNPSMIPTFGYGWFKFVQTMETSSAVAGNVVVNGSPVLFNYESAWSLIRWAADQYGTSDASFFTAFVQTPLTGVANLTARTGQSMTTLLGKWSLMTATDDRTGFVPVDASIASRSYRVRDFLAGTRTVSYPNVLTGPAWPLNTYSGGTGTFAFNVAALVPGSASIFELGAPGAPATNFELRASGGGAFPAGTPLRIAIARIQ